MLRRIVQLSFNRIVGQSLTIVLGGALLLMPAIAFADEPTKNVLLFYSDEFNRPGNMLVTQAIRSTLNEHWKSPIQIYDEGQDSLRIPNEKYETELVALLQRKYEGVHFDLIFAFAPPALRFLLKHKAALFPDAPVVFIVNEQKRIADLKLENTTGVSGKVEVTPTLELVLTLHPQTQRVVVAGGTALLDRDLLALAQKEFKPYDGKVSFTYLTDMTLEEMRQRLALLPEQTVVIFLSFNSDSSGKAYASHEVVSRLAESSSAPIYALNQSYFGTGIVGGRLLSYEAVGLRAAEIGVRILGGERAQNISPQVLPSVTMVDWRQLRRWGIDEAQIPPGSVVGYKEFSVWELYKWRIVGVISLIVVQALSIVWLLFTRTKRRQAEERSTRFARLAESEHQHLDEIVANVPGVVWEARLEDDDPIPKATFVSPYVGKMLGYSVEEWLREPCFAQSIILEEDREEAAEEIGTVLESGREGVVRFRWKAKDGRVLWVESHIAPMRDETEKTVGLRGVTLDISGRKHDEQALQQLSGRLLMVQDEEQRRVAGELHDGLGQNLAIIKNRALMGLRDRTNQDRITEQLEEIVLTATSSIDEVREIARNLRPYELDRLGLVAAIESMIERVSHSTSINLSADLEPIEGLLSPEAETSVYRILQEGLNNVIKHSQATAARIEIKKNANQLLISVRDNGKGIPSRAPAENGNKKAGFGLAGIAQRVRGLGGSVEIDSHPSRGTTLNIALELANGEQK